MITQTLTDSFKLELLQGVHDFSTDTFNIALYSTTASLGANTTAYSAAGEISGTGYTAGGNTLLVAAGTPAVVNGVAYVGFQNVTWSAATFSAAGALIYNVSQGGKSVAVLNFGAVKTVTGLPFTVQFPTATYNNALIRVG